MSIVSLGRLAALFGAIAGVWLPCGCVAGGEDSAFEIGAPWDSGVKETRTILMDHVAAKPLHVQSSNGSIIVAKSKDASVSVTAKIQAQTEERLKATQIIAKRLDDGTLDVQVKWPDNKSKNNEGVSFEIALPDAKDLKLTTSNGSISADSMAGSAVLATSNATITVTRQDGPVNATSSNGSVTVSDAAGAVTAESSNGTVKVQNAASTVKAKTSNGSIDVGMKPDATGPVKLTSSNGRVKLTVGPSFSGVLSAGTSNGSLTVSGIEDAKVTKSKNSAKVRFSDQGPDSVIETSNASVEISRR